MDSQSDKLTPRQQCWFAATLLFIGLAFGSVFAYAHWSGQRARAMPVQAVLLPPPADIQMARPVPHEFTSPQSLTKSPTPLRVARIPRGKSGLPTFVGHEETTGSWLWIIHQKKTGKAYGRDSAAANWVVNATTGALSIPIKIPVGRYSLSILSPTPENNATPTCSCYEFEVIENDGLPDSNIAPDNVTPD